jgi:predicted enzyme related to lactoylglutathione lyase
MTGGTRDATISWVDLSTPDVEGARRFYGALLGWELTTRHTDMGDYTVASTGDRDVAGMMAQAPEMEGAPAGWSVFVVVDDIDATLARVAEAGGTVRQTPFEIPGGARVAVVADCSGAMLALITGGPEPGPYFADDVGGVCWAELMTRHPDRAERFYRAALGWTAERSDGGVDYTEFRRGDESVAGMIRTPDDLPPEVPDAWSVYFTVADCREAERRAAELGGSVLLTTTATPMGPFAVLADPAGAAFQVMQLSPAGSPD